MNYLLEIMLKKGVKWPASAHFATQNFRSRLISFFSSVPELRGKTWTYGDTGALIDSVPVTDLADDWDTCVLSKHDYYLEGGWISRDPNHPASTQLGEHEVCYRYGPARIVEDITQVMWPDVKFFRRVVSQPGPALLEMVEPVMIEMAEPVIIDDNPGYSWYERGEFPPGGCECEFSSSDHEWDVWCRSVFVGFDSLGNGVVSVFGDEEGRLWVSDKASDFRPLRTEREKAIEDMSRIIHEHGGVINDISLGALLDAGYHKGKTE